MSKQHQGSGGMRKILSGLTILGLLMVFGCGDIGDSITAEAGLDQRIYSRGLVTLSGRSSGVDPEQVKYKWKLLSKPRYSRTTVFEDEASEFSFVADVSGSYLLSLTVSDGERTSEADTVEVIFDTTASAQTDARTVVDAWAALQAQIDRTGSGSRIDLDPRIIYKLTSSIDLRNYSDIVIDGHGATIIRADASEVSTTLKSDYDGSTTILVDSIPSNYHLGDTLVIASGKSINDVTINPRTIVSLNDGLITVDYPFDGVFKKGASVIKSFALIHGMGSNIDGGSNPGTVIQNVEFDGNARNNDINLGWVVNGTVGLHGGGTSVIRYNRFIDISNENIVGHGFAVHHNTFDGLNGSALHTSLHDRTKSINRPASFTDNAVFNANRIAKNVNGHSEGAVTFSWGPGLYIARNFFLSESGNYGVFGNFIGSSENSNEDLLIENNFSFGFEYIIFIYSPIETPTKNILITNNVFDQSGSFLTRDTENNVEIRLGCNTDSTGKTIPTPPSNSSCQ